MNATELQRSIFILLLNIGVARILDWRGPNHNSHAMTSSEIFKGKHFCGTKISLNKYIVDLSVQQRI